MQGGLSRRPADLRRNTIRVLPGLISIERSEAVGTQLGISDRPAFLSHPGCAKAAVGAYEMIVSLTLADVLRRRLAPLRVVMRAGWDRGCLYRRGSQSHQTDQRWDDHSHFILCIGGQRGSVRATSLRKAESKRCGWPTAVTRVGAPFETRPPGAPQEKG